MENELHQPRTNARSNRDSICCSGAISGRGRRLRGISSLVAQRTPEIGIRMALGAEPNAILHSTIREGLQLALAGLSIGVLVSFAFGPMLRSILYGVRSGDPRIFAAVIAALLFVSLAACYIPARRAARVDPIIALRAE